MELDDKLCTESLLNIIMDEIDDIIMIHDSHHTIVWINRAGLKVLKKTLAEVSGKKCYKLFGRSSCCEDCSVALTPGILAINKPHKSFPGLDTEYDCSSVPLYKDGEIALVVQHLRPVKK